MIPQNCVLYLEQCDKKKEKDEEHLLPKLLSVVTVVIVLSGFLVCVCVCVCVHAHMYVFTFCCPLSNSDLWERNRGYMFQISKVLLNDQNPKTGVILYVLLHQQCTYMCVH